jgi:hypothetical protein
MIPFFVKNRFLQFQIRRYSPGKTQQEAGGEKKEKKVFFGLKKGVRGINS